MASERVGMESDALSIAAYVDAAAVLHAMPLDDQRRAAVVAVMTRLAAFAADVAAVELGEDVEIAGTLGR